MSAARRELREALCRYTTDTLTYMNTVREFCVNILTWMSRMEADLSSMKNIKDNATSDKRRGELEQVLVSVLRATLKDLEKLDCFLDAVEKLAVTSIYVFMEENHQVLCFPKGIKPELVQVVIVAARLICPLLLQFKRDAAVFFLPKLQNVEVLSYQLDKYIQTTQVICERFQESGVQNLLWNMNKKVVVDLGVDLSQNDMQMMLCHITLVDDIRMNPNFRMVFLFQEVSCFKFIREFNNCKPRMLQFLKDLEESAVQLDRMNKGAKISSVAGSSMGVLGGVLSIAGLALGPATGGLSVVLTMTGLGLGITSGVNGVVTTVTEMGVNCTQKTKANKVFKSFMEDMQSIQNCVEEIISQPLTELVVSKTDVSEGINKLLKTLEAVRNTIKNLAEVGKKAASGPGKLASDIPDVGQAVVKGPLALTKSARVGLIALNALFIGMDVLLICKDGISLAKGSETEVSQFIRARAALWSSEMDSWQKIHDSLCEGRQKSEKNKAILETPFYPEAQSQFAYMVKHAGYFLLTLPLIGLIMMFLYYPPN